MKVLHVLDQSLPNISGYSLRSKYILEYQKRAGIDVFALTSPNQQHGFPVERIDNIPYYRTRPYGLWKIELLNGNPVGRALAFIFSMKRGIYNVVRKERIDLIHAHSPTLCGEAALLAGRKIKIPVIYEIRAFWEDAAVDQGKTEVESLRYRLTQRMETRLIRKVDAVVALCQGIRDDLRNRAVRTNKIFIVPNAIAIENFRPGVRDRELSAKYDLDNQVVLGFIGSFFEFEGLHLLLQAFSELLSSQSNVKLLMIGGGEKERELRDLASRFNPSGDRIIFTGRVPHDTIQQHYTLIDVFIYPRMRNRLTELTTPLKPLEAMAMEKAVIASDVGGLRELVDNGRTGLLFRSGDINDLITKLTALIENPKLRNRLGRNGRKHVEAEKSWSKNAARYLKLYQRFHEV